MNLSWKDRFVAEAVFNAGDGVPMFGDPREPASFAIAVLPAATVNKHYQRRILDTVRHMQIEQQIDAVNRSELDVPLDGDGMRRVVSDRAMLSEEQDQNYKQ